ncbi:unnamed protein product [Ranitomeya imitator]|uniref:Uncharacterized protein n=1 Tax=Ranitomeya imitator TaxID=111125 RepID=A0ABN9LAA8_9NEOB|nr:unnamed protein product [Ranitomeya imitator]
MTYMQPLNTSCNQRSSPNIL